MKKEPRSKLVHAVVISIILGLVAATVGFLLIISPYAAQKNSQLNKVGVLEIENIPGQKVEKRAQELTVNYQISSENGLPKHVAALNYLLALSPLKDLSAKSHANFYLLDKTPGNSLTKYKAAGFNVDQIDLVLVSGSNIYFVQESFALFDNPVRLYQNLMLSLEATRLFETLELNSLPENTNYQLANSPLWQEFLTSKNGKNVESAATVLEADQITTNSYCPTASVDNLLCSMSEILNQSIGQVSPDLEKYWQTNFPEILLDPVKIVDLNALNYFKQLVSDYQLHSASLEFTDWQGLLPEQSTTSQLFFNEVSAETIGALNKKLVLDGWELQLPETDLTHSTFQVPLHKTTWQSQNPLGIKTITILSLDTTKLTNDCITEATAGQYCSTKSIYKNSGNYLEVLLDFQARVNIEESLS